MHMSDALLSPVVGGAMYAVSAVSIAYAVQKVKKDELGEKNLPMMAVAGAFTFAAQMINFTIPGTGSSGHIGGGILLVGLLGGTPAVVTLTAVLLIQCLFFADGGLLALGANIFNMGVIPCLFVCPLIFRPILRKGVTHKRIMIASVVSCVVGLQLGAFCVVLQTLTSGVTELPFHTFVLLMQPIHLAIGFVEGIITAGILNFVYQMRPEILTDVLERLEKPVERIRYIEEADKGRSDSVSAKKVILLFADGQAEDLLYNKELMESADVEAIGGLNS
ncbi:cobalamin (Vitamin B12) biosynthesis CbiM protein [Dorea sp. CAG:105]|nr:cobalamin (Vitamin B12) biosynthesis CbiM protein [Dorea sp. CAG:105]